MKRKCIALVLCLFLLCHTSNCTYPVKAVSKTVSEKQFISMLIKGMGWRQSGQSVYTVAYSKKIVKTSDKKKWNQKLTRKRAALFLNRADIAANGNIYDKNLYKKIIMLHRISDLKKIASSYRSSVVRMFEKGIIIGDSNGLYAQSRRFSPNSKVSYVLANRFILRLHSHRYRKNISADGQLIRTKHLPKNAKDYPYILQSFPNQFYETKFEYQRTKYYDKPIHLVDYASPAQIGKMKFVYGGVSMQSVMDQNLQKWCSKVKKNIQTRFNVNYKTVDSEWISRLRSTYYIFPDDATANKRQTNDIKEYVKKMKENKVVVEAGRISVEPSTLYNNGSPYIRVYVNFKVKQCKDIKKINNIIYNDGIRIENVKINQWKKCYFDIGIGSSNGCSLGDDYSVVDNILINIK